MKNLMSFLLPLLLVTIVFSCRKADEYKMYLEGGEIVYPAKAVEVKVHPGDYRLMLSWLRTDPRVIEYAVTWNLGADSVIVKIPTGTPVSAEDPVTLYINDLVEDTYEFKIVSRDEDGNRSVPTTVQGRVYGDNYRTGLLPRGIRDIDVSPTESTATIRWFESDSTDVGALFSYIQMDGSEAELLVENTEGVSVLSNYRAGTSFTYRSAFKPNSLGIDMFYSDEVSVPAPQATYPDLDRSLFVAYPLPGDATAIANWPKSNLWDGRTLLGTTEYGFHSNDGGFPSHITIDLGVTAELHHFKLWQRYGVAPWQYFQFWAGNPWKFEIWGSTNPPADGSFSNWSKLGEFESKKPSGLPFPTAGNNSTTLGVHINQQDVDYVANGEFYRFSQATIPVRYIRIRIINIFQQRANNSRLSWNLYEASFAGLPI